jgi:hypothetical protein
MFDRTDMRCGPEDPEVAEVETILTAVASKYTPSRPADPLVVEHALWLCACVSEADDCPTWLIHDTAAGGVAWCRVPDGLDIPDLVDARLIAGAHVHPSEMLSWLKGQSAVPWSDGDSDQAVLSELGRKLGAWGDA